MIKKILLYILVFIISFFAIEASSTMVGKLYHPHVKMNNINTDIVNILRLFGLDIGNEEEEKIVIDIDSDEFDMIDGVNAISSGRLYIYKAVFRYIDYGDYLLLGTGPDNMHIYAINYIHRLTKQVNMTEYDKAHNVYLNVLAETGIFSLIVYVAWIVSYHLKTKKCKNELMYLLLFGLISYNIQGLFNIDVFMVMPYYFIIAGMLMGIGDKLETRKH